MVYKHWYFERIFPRTVYRIFIITFCVLISFSKANSTDSKSYFQQQLSYKIKVTLNDELNFLNGDISIEYKNNSGDTLELIWMHLWPNAYKDRNTALSQQLISMNETGLYFASSNERGYIDSLSFSVDNQPVEFIYDDINIDMGWFKLNAPLLPGMSIHIQTPFRVKLPSNKFSRLGHFEQSYCITQWYPKPAVYDVNGWHPLPYLTLGEFYSEFGNYEVQITLPSNYVVASTGILMEQEEMEFIKMVEEKTKNKLDFHGKDTVPVSSDVLKTITYTQDSIHDFAWFANKQFNVSSLKFQVPGSEKEYTARVFYTDKKAEIWKNTPDIIKNGILFLTEEVGAYAYNSFTAVDGLIAAGGGMEYPMITIINTPASKYSHESTVFHELCHNWFYGMLANDERQNAWMDEGITSYFELKYKERFMNGTIAGNGEFENSNFIVRAIGLNKFDASGIQQLSYKLSAFNNSDQPIAHPAKDFTALNYGTVVYAKSAQVFKFLKEYLGDSLFRLCMQTYFNEWSFKHPQPSDLQSVFEKVSERDLSWFFNDLLKNNHPNRYEITGITSNTNSSAISLRNRDGRSIPLKIENDKNESIWVDGFSDTTSVYFPFVDFKKLHINREYKTIFKSNDRSYRVSGILKTSPKLQVRIFPKLIDGAETEHLYLMPVPAWNHYNRWMGGFYFANMDLIPEPFEFFVVPLYDFKNSSLAGVGGIDYTLWPLRGAFNAIKLSARYKRFAYKENRNAEGIQDSDHPIANYMKFAPSIQLDLRKTSPLATLQQQFEFRNITTWVEEIVYTRIDGGFTGDSTITVNNFNELNYRLTNDRNIDPYSLNLRGENGKDFTKISTEFNYRFSYSKKKKGADIRFFAGTFINHNTNLPQYNLTMSGISDYLYDETYFGRTDDTGLWNQQFVIKEGGFKVLSGFGTTNKWLASVNIKVDVPLPVPVKVYFDIGTYEGISDVVESYTGHFMYNGGLALVPVRDVFEIYIPLFMSDDIKSNLELRNVTFAEQIRFVFNLNKLAPMNVRNRLIQNLQ